MKNVYLLSGLGADKRVFDFLDLSHYHIHFLDWIEPEDNESFEAYARRLSRDLEGKCPILLGISFGGMMAIEIGKLMRTEKIIIISSARTRKSIPSNFIARTLKLHKRLPARLFLKPNEILYWLFGARKKREKVLLRSILQDMNETFFRWAIDRIMNWDNEVILDNIVHIHGSNDRIIPFTSADFKIEGGGHLMVVSRASEINTLLSEIIDGGTSGK